MKKKITALLTLTLLFGGCALSGEPNYESEIGGTIPSATEGVGAGISVFEDFDTSAAVSESVNSENSSKANNYTPPEGSLILKWGVNNLGSGFDGSLVSEFNEALHKYGCDFSVEFVDLYKERLFDYGTGTFDLRQAITDYEKSGSRLDIIDMSFSEGGIGIEGGQPEEGKRCEFALNGLLEPLDKSSIMPDNVFPDEIWDMEKIGGVVYTLPSCTLLYPKVLTVGLNTDYISQETISDYDGSLEGLVNILSELPKYGRSVCVLDMSQTYYETSSVSSEFDFVQSLALDYKTKKAVNPFEHQQFLDYARTLNKAYGKGLINSNTGGGINFSTYGGCFDFSEDKKTEVISFISEGKISDDEIKNIFNAEPEKFKEFSYSKAYIKNTSSGNIGISTFSEHKEQALRLLNAICNDSDCALALQDIGIYRPLAVIDAETFENNAAEAGLSLSPVAGYKISYTDVSEYNEIKIALYSFFDELCHAEDFEAKLDEINAELKKMGIDDFVDKVNASLAKNGHAPD